MDRVRAGDRVVVMVAKDDFEQERRQAEPGSASSIDGKIKSLRNAWAMVEVQEILFLMEFGNSVMLLDISGLGSSISDTSTCARSLFRRIQSQSRRVCIESG